MRFRTSKLYESALVPILLGLLVGFLAAIMGVGGAFVMVPAMIYLIGMPTRLVPGTSLFVTIFITALVTVSHAYRYQTIDLILVAILITGSIMGVHFGQKIGQRLRGSELKTLLALLLLAVGILMAYDTFFRNNLINASSNPADKIIEINYFSSAIFNIANKYPLTYGLTSIFIALCAGIGVSFLRKYLSQRFKSKRTST